MTNLKDLLSAESLGRFAELFGSEKAKGTIDDASLTAIKQITSNYEDASPKLLKRFGLK